MKFHGPRRERTLRHCNVSLFLVVGLSLIATLVAWNVVMIMNFNYHDSNQQNHLRSPAAFTVNRSMLPASVWATREIPNMGTLALNISSLLTAEERERSLKLCGKFLYSTLDRAVHLKNMGQDAYVATGDITSMWIRDSVVQMSIYMKHVADQPWLRFILDGAIRRNAFNIIQDPYANAYERKWVDPASLELKDQVIGRGGFVATRNYELDSGAYFLVLLYDYFVADNIYRPEVLLQEAMVFEAVMAMINVWIVEQRHDELSRYRYFELPNEGKGAPTGYTGMSWTGFRPSDDPCKYGYLIPANIHAAAALQRVLILNERIWQSEKLQEKTSKLLKEIENGINTYGIVHDEAGEAMYAYEVDGLGNVLDNFDDANVPSLLSIPLLGWDGYDRRAYENTRRYLLSHSNKVYYEGKKFKGIGSPHTPPQYIWPMAMVIQGLTEEGPDRAEKMAFQMRQLMMSATEDAMHESVHQDDAARFTRVWFEWVSPTKCLLFVPISHESTQSSPTAYRPMRCL